MSSVKGGVPRTRGTPHTSGRPSALTYCRLVVDHGVLALAGCVDFASPVCVQYNETERDSKVVRSPCSRAPGQNFFGSRTGQWHPCPSVRGKDGAPASEYIPAARRFRAGVLYAVCLVSAGAYNGTKAFVSVDLGGRRIIKKKREQTS